LNLFQATIVFSNDMEGTHFSNPPTREELAEKLSATIGAFHPVVLEIIPTDMGPGPSTTEILQRIEGSIRILDMIMSQLNRQLETIEMIADAVAPEGPLK